MGLCGIDGNFLGFGSRLSVITRKPVGGITLAKRFTILMGGETTDQYDTEAVLEKMHEYFAYSILFLTVFLNTIFLPLMLGIPVMAVRNLYYYEVES